ncbi:MAG: hypothetical protein ACMUIE_09405, partial [Thermoplasmatota archaeon]
TANWFDLGLSLASISALLLSNGETTMIRDKIGSLISNSNRCIEDLELKGLVNFSPFEEWLDQEDSDRYSKQALFEHMVGQMKMIDARFGK